ncbi:MAG: nucleotidyl transferase AbiEii/AbiGii toxin family protein [Lachnospiraceae bacterium]
MELMEFLYRVMEELSNAGIPIVFKGAMVLNLALRENNPSKVERMTRDIDGDWVGELPTMDEMENALRSAVKKVDSSLDIYANRIFGERKSAGFMIVSKDGEKVASVDLSVRQNQFCSSYISYVNGILINGASLSKMLSDKIYVISGESL